MEQKLNNEKRNFFKDLKNIKRNYKIVKSHPLAGMRFKYLIQRNTIIVFGLFLIYQFYSIIKNYSGMGYMSWIGRGLTLLILFIILSKGYTSMKVAKKNLKHEEDYYKNNPNAYKETPQQDVKNDVDEILKKFNESKGRKK